MRTFLLILSFFSCSEIFATDGSKALIVGLRTNSVEGYGKFRILQQKGDTLYAVSGSADVMPGMYLITASSKNEFYHKKLLVIDPSFTQYYSREANQDILALFVGITETESYAKMDIVSDDNYHVSNDPKAGFDPGTYLIIGSSNHELYHKKLVVTPQ